jgi:predicted transcriptional regulator
MGTAATERVAVMAIHPRYADAILKGEKLVEFRKRKLADDISTVLIYATAPVQKVIGEFRIAETVVDAPASIWAAYGDVGIIDESSFEHYYASTTSAVAFLVGEATRYPLPRTLSEIQGGSIPQSFYYVSRKRPAGTKDLVTEAGHLQSVELNGERQVADVNLVSETSSRSMH